MATVKFIEYGEARPEVRDVYDDIMKTRQTDRVNNFWKALAVQPDLLQRTWSSVKQMMAPVTLDPLTKEMIYVAVSVTNGCTYCINTHTAAAVRAEGGQAGWSRHRPLAGGGNGTCNARAHGRPFFSFTRRPAAAAIFFTKGPSRRQTRQVSIR